MQFFTQRHRAGFTITELMVVILIIGLFSSIIAINYNVSQAKARDAQRINDLQQIKLALNLYKQEYGHYPRESEGYSGGDSQGIICTDPAVCSSERLNTPINLYLRSVMGEGVRDPRHNEGVGAAYWYYYDGVKSCSDDFHAVTLHARRMEVGTNVNIDGLEEKCPRFESGANEGRGISASNRSAHLIILEFLDRSEGWSHTDW